MENLTEQELREFLKNHFTYKNGKIFHKVGTYILRESGKLNQSGSLDIYIYNKNYLAHKLIWFMRYGYYPKHHIYHKNGDKTDNRISNLTKIMPEYRREEKKIQMQNRAINRNNTSGVKGVTWFERTKRWRVDIMINGKQIFLGYFKDFDKAVFARYEAEGRKKHGSAYNYLKENNLL